MSDQPTNGTARAAVLPRIRAAVNLDASLDAVIVALEAEEAAARATYEQAKERYRMARQAVADARQIRGLVKVAADPKARPAGTAEQNGATPSEGRWSPNHDACVSCGRSSVKHMARGLCGGCYSREMKAKS